MNQAGVFQVPTIVDGEAFRFSPAMSVAERTRAFAKATGNPVAEFVRWLQPIDEQITLNKDGALLACFDFSGLDLDSAANVEINQVRSQLIYAVEQLQEEPLVMTWQVRRRITKRYPEAVFPDPVSQRIDDAQRASFLANVQYINRHNVSLCLYPAASTARILAKLQKVQENSGGIVQSIKALFSGLISGAKGEAEFPYENLEEISQALEQFHKLIDMFLAATLPLGVRLLSGSDLGGFLELCSSPTSEIDTVSDLPNSEAYMDTCMPVADINNSYRDMLHFEHNGREVWGKCYSIDLRKRQDLQMDMLDKLMASPFEYTMSHVFKFLPRGKGEKMVAEVETYHSNRRYPLKSILVAAIKGGDLSGVPVNDARQEATDEAKNLRDRITVGQIGVGLYYGVVMVQAATAETCKEAGDRCEEILQTARLLPREEKLHKFSSFAATVPGSHEEIARWQKIKTLNFVDLCPLRTVAQGDFYNAHLSQQLGTPSPALLVLPTKHRTPFYFTGYVGDLGHALIIGPSGTGKTTIAILAWTAFRKYKGSRVIVFDKNYSCRPAILLQGGKYIDLNPEKQTGEKRPMMSPLAALLKDGNTTHLAFCASWIELLTKMRGYIPTAGDRLSLEQALRGTVALGITNTKQLRLSSIIAQLDMESDFAKSLLPWVEGQVYGSYFDNDEDHFDLTELGGVEMGTVLSHEELAAPFMSYAFYRIASQLRDMGASTDRPIPTLIYIPETWYFIRQPVFAGELEEWLVTLRKLGGVVWFDTQSPDKLVQSPIFAAFRDNIATKIFTPNRMALTQSLGDMYRNEFALMEHEIQYIANGIGKRDYFISQGRISRRISLGLNAEVMACIRSDTKAQLLMDRYHGKTDWQDQYIKELSND
jgi:type IV secretion system protein TrbE